MTIEQAIAEYREPTNRGIVDAWKQVSRDAHSVLSQQEGWECKEHKGVCFARPSSDILIDWMNE